MPRERPGHKEREQRTFLGSVEVREIDGKPVIEGLAAVFDKWSEPLGWDGFVEKVDRSAFDDVLSKRPDVRGLFNHDPNLIFGRTTAGTMELEKTADGLRYRIVPPDTEQARALVEAIRRGDVTGSSFTFIADADKWEFKKDAPDQRTLMHISDLFDVGPVTFPAYPDTTAAARARDVQRGGAAAARLLAQIAEEEIELV